MLRSMEQHPGQKTAENPDDPFIPVYPQAILPGVLTVVVKKSRLKEIQQLQEVRERRVWRVRGVVSDSVPLSGWFEDTFQRALYSRFFIEPDDDPKTIYLDFGGSHAVYFDLVGDENHQLRHVETRVSCQLPLQAIVSSRRYLNALLDVITRDYHLPLVVQRIELMSPTDGEILAYQSLLPNGQGVELGPLGGIGVSAHFAPYYALYREGMTSSSPFYRFICGFKLYEGRDSLMQMVREQCAAKGVTLKPPKDVEIKPEELNLFGIGHKGMENVKNLKDFYGCVSDLRDAISHFFITREGEKQHIYLASGEELHRYSAAGSALLHYSHISIQALNVFYNRHLLSLRGSVLPTIQKRDQFIIRVADL
jgi:hypothetical protein